MAEQLRFMSQPISLFFIIFFMLLNLINLHSLVLSSSVFSAETPVVSSISRGDFPPGFVFGAGSSAYQIEGAVAEDGRKPNIWDSYAHAGKISDKSTGDVAADQYHKYKEDVKLMYNTGLDAYRFSFSWSRILPDGRGEVNPKGLEYYNNLINELVSHGIEPHVTLSHFDIPQILQDEYGGLISPKIIEDFVAYAELCFKEFGDRVKYWMTFCEPNVHAMMGYDVGTMPPERCSYPFGAVNCTEGDSTTEPYIAAHNTILSHAAAANLYKHKYQETQRGRIGITVLAFWLEPLTNSPQDIVATKRSLDFHLGWFLDPLVYGNYPASMRKIVGSRLPVFTENESNQIRGSFDFLGLNHYCVLYVKDLRVTPDSYGNDYMRDEAVLWSIKFGDFRPVKDFIRVRAPSMPIAPWGLEKVMEYVKLKYKNPATMIHENGYAEAAGDDSSNPSAHNDTGRIEYLNAYIRSVLSSVRNGSNVMGYFVWSFMDCFEWTSGYSMRFGLYGVDFKDKDLKRYPRLSAHWYSSLLAKSGRKIESSAYLYDT